MGYKGLTSEERVQMVENYKEQGYDFVHMYLRSDAIRDGVLIDLTDGPPGFILSMEGFRIHTACTSEVYESVIGHLSDSEWNEDHAARLTRLLFTIRQEVNRAREHKTETRMVDWSVISADGARTIEGYMLLHEGDRGEPCFTIMLNGQD